MIDRYALHRFAYRLRHAAAARRTRRSETTGIDSRRSKVPTNVTIPGEKPRILMLADRPNWAFDYKAKSLASRLSNEFDIRICHVRNQPDLAEWGFDLLYIFFWGESYHHRYGIDRARVVKEISSHRWANESQFGYLTPAQTARRYLDDAGTLTSTSRRLLEAFRPFREVHHTPNGFEPSVFRVRKARSGPLRVGWAGNRNDRCKGLDDILVPAVGSRFELRVAGGELDQEEMSRFYNDVDVICVASTAEGTPFPLIEGMACGCFPVTVDVGIAPEVIRHGSNGLVVKRRRSSFRSALEWCAANLEHIREVGLINAGEMLETRTWDRTSECWRHVFRHAYCGLVDQTASAAMPSPPEGDERVDR